MGLSDGQPDARIDRLFALADKIEAYTRDLEKAIHAKRRVRLGVLNAAVVISFLTLYSTLAYVSTIVNILPFNLILVTIVNAAVFLAYNKIADRIYHVALEDIEMLHLGPESYETLFLESRYVVEQKLDKFLKEKPAFVSKAYYRSYHRMHILGYLAIVAFILQFSNIDTPAIVYQTLTVIVQTVFSVLVNYIISYSAYLWAATLGRLH